jgi:hypothetical protein
LETWQSTFADRGAWVEILSYAFPSFGFTGCPTGVAAVAPVAIINPHGHLAEGILDTYPRPRINDV